MHACASISTGGLLQRIAPAPLLSQTTAAARGRRVDAALFRPLGDAASKKNATAASGELLYYEPDEQTAANLLLIVDGREDRPDSSRGRSISTHLAQRGVAHELRPLAVGDYLWVVRLGEGATQEMLMDYVVERKCERLACLRSHAASDVVGKTWEDLRVSIRQMRYYEQKQRLHACGVRHVVLVVEGGDCPDRALEQAIATSSVEDGFLIQRTAHLASTARFLADLTEHLQRRLRTERVSFLALTYSAITVVPYHTMATLCADPVAAFRRLCRSQATRSLGYKTTAARPKRLPSPTASCASSLCARS